MDTTSRKGNGILVLGSKEVCITKKTTRTLTSWKNLPDNWGDNEGFIYLITNTLTNRKYVGRKYFWTKKRNKIVGESDWRTYKSSSKELVSDIEKFGESNFTFEILSVHRNRHETNYAEVKEQFSRNVLEEKLGDGTEAYYNKNIMSRYFKPQDFGTEAWEQRCQNISHALKSAYNTGRVQHPLKGKPHPNRGKKLPQTANGKPGGWFSITDGNTTRHIYEDASIPEGWWRGMAPRKKKYVPPRRSQICAYCGIQKILAVREHKTKYCNSTCQNQAHSERMKQKYENGDHTLVELNKTSGKYSPDQIRAIRLDTRTYKLIAQEYGTTTGTVSQIKNRKAYKDVE